MLIIFFLPRTCWGTETNCFCCARPAKQTPPSDFLILALKRSDSGQFTNPENSTWKAVFVWSGVKVPHYPPQKQFGLEDYNERLLCSWSKEFREWIYDMTFSLRWHLHLFSACDSARSCATSPWRRCWWARSKKNGRSPRLSDRKGCILFTNRCIHPWS